MTKQCPNCEKEFIEQRDAAFRCEDCGWFRNVDGKWHTCPEPVKPADPEPPKRENVPAPAEPVPKPKPADSEPTNGDRHVKQYLGGLVTVETIEDDEDDGTDD